MLFNDYFLFCIVPDEYSDERLKNPRLRRVSCDDVKELEDVSSDLYLCEDDYQADQKNSDVVFHIVF